MRACQAIKRSSAFRYALLVGLLGARVVLAQSSATQSCVPYSHNGGDDDDDIDEDGEDGDHSRTHSWCAGPTGSGSWTKSFGSPTWTGAGGASATDASASTNSNLSANGGGFNKGSIAGIVLGVVAFLVIALLLLTCIRRRYAQKRKLARKETFIGPAIATAAHQAAGTKEVGHMSQTMANVAPSRPPGLHRSLSRETLPQIPYDTPAYTSTDNLASLSYVQSQTQRASTVVSFGSPSEATTGVTAATAGHGSSNGYRHASMHEDMLARQKELETTYSEKEMGEFGSSPSSPTSRSDHSIIHMNLPEHPPPRYND